MNAKYYLAKPALSVAATLLLGGMMSANTAAAAGCQPGTVMNLKPTSIQYNYRPNNQSTIRMFVDGNVKNAGRKTYTGNSGGNRASTIHLIAEDGRGDNHHLGSIKVTDYLSPYNCQTRIVANQRLVIPAVNLHDFKVSLKATIENPGCVGIAKTIWSKYTWDLRDVRAGGRAKLVGRPSISYVGPPKPRGNTGAPRPRVRS